MPSSSEKQAYTAKMAGKLKRGEDVLKFHVTNAMKSMSKMPMDKLRHFMKIRESMTSEQKKKLLITLKKLQESYSNTGNVGGETDITNADNLMVSEEAPANKNVMAKTFDTEGDFDSYVNQNRGIEMTPKEQQAVLGYKTAKPTQQDKFFVKYEITDGFGHNSTTIIKKMKERE